MNEKRNCLVGRDSDGAGIAGWLIGVMIVLFIIMSIVMIMVFAGVFIGGFHSLRNYFLALKHNVIDSNRRPAGA